MATHAARIGKASLIAVALLALSAEHARAQTFVGLGVLPGGTMSRGTRMSDDGSIVVGYGDVPGGTLGFRWTAATGIVPIAAPAMSESSSANCISGNGRAIIQTYFDSDFGPHIELLSPSGMVDEILPPPGAGWFFPHAISFDGSIVAGETDFDGGAFIACRWTQAGGYQSLGMLHENGSSAPFGTSRDGNVLVGVSSTAGDSRAFRWTEAGGMLDLGKLPGDADAIANGVSGDGTVVVGDSVASGIGISRAFRWSETIQGGAMSDLGGVPGWNGSGASFVSDDGTTIAGNLRAYSATLDRTGAMVWTSARGMQDLNVYLPSLGIDLTGWELTDTAGLSADGRTILGVGTHEGQDEAWIATLPQQCRADFDGSGSLEIQDIFDFLNAWFGGDPRADFNGGGLSAQDIFDFLGAWFTGCP